MSSPSLAATAPQPPVAGPTAAKHLGAALSRFGVTTTATVIGSHPSIALLRGISYGVRQFDWNAEAAAGSTGPRLPFAPSSVSCMLVFPPAGITPKSVQYWLGEVGRVTRGTVVLLVRLHPSAEAEQPGTRAWWESLAFIHGLRKHPLFQGQEATELSRLLATSGETLLLFEALPAQAARQFPLSSLHAERGLHNDMLREPGRRAEAHTARYAVARALVQPGFRVLDVACGLGYGAPILSRGIPKVEVQGVDCSPFGIEYARANYTSVDACHIFALGDATALSFPNATFDLAVTFETIEHLLNPERFVAELGRVLRPGGRLVLSVPNRWVDQEGRNPVPWHLHVYDFALLRSQLEVHFRLDTVLRQNAGGGWKRPQPDGLRVVPDKTPTPEDLIDAEWWVVIATRRERPVTPSADRVLDANPGASAQPRLERIVVLDEPQRSTELFGRAFDELGITPVYAQGRGLDEVLALAPQVIVLSREWTPEWRLIAAAARKRSVPVVYVMDGVLEWSYLWNNLSHIRPHGTMLQPLLASDLCVIGQHPARILSAMGLGEHIHVTGLPRLDPFDTSRRIDARGRPHILVASARTAGHDLEQQLMNRRALRDLKAFFDTRPDLRVTWRIAADLAEDIEVTPDIAGTLEQRLAEATALITCPSTCVLEAMLKGLPVAQLEYRPVPLYVASAWEIRCADHIPNVVQELLYPPPAKLAWQDACRNDELAPGPASPRLAEVLQTAFQRTTTAPAADVKPPGDAVIHGRLDYRQIHSELTAFAAQPSTVLQYELDAAHALLRQSRAQRVESQRESVELIEGAFCQDLNRLRVYSLVDAFPQAERLAGASESASVGTATLAGRTSRTIFTSAPAQLAYTLPVGAAGMLSLALALHPETWTNPASGPCRFEVLLNGDALVDATLDARDDVAARQWFWFNLPVSPVADRTHRLELRATGIGGDAFRWALWRNPLFLWTCDDAKAFPGHVAAAARQPDFYRPGRSVS